MTFANGVQTFPVQKLEGKRSKDLGKEKQKELNPGERVKGKLIRRSSRLRKPSWGKGNKKANESRGRREKLKAVGRTVPGWG